MIYFNRNIQNFFVLVYFVCHTPQFKTLVFSFRSESWIVQNFNFTVFEDFCLSLSWKYRFLQNVNHAKVQSKTNKYCKFHVDLTRRRLSIRVRFFGRIRKRICDPRSYGFFDAKETQNPKKDYFVMTRQAGGTQYIYPNNISLVLP